MDDRMSVTLTLPYPVSNNRYWRSKVVGGIAMTYVSSEAKQYKAQVAEIVRAAGIVHPILGRVEVHIELYPHRPLDYKKRMAADPVHWAETVQCIDLDNARKVLYDALKCLVFMDDKWIWRDSGERMEPDEHGARVVVRVTEISYEYY